MNDMKNYEVRIVRSAGFNPLTGVYSKQVEENIIVYSEDEAGAYKKSLLLCTLKFEGQIRNTFINDQEYLNPLF